MIAHRRDNDRVIATFSSPIGSITFTWQGENVVAVQLNSKNKPLTSLALQAKEAKNSLECYFKDPRQLLRLPYQLTGTAFQKKVWKHLQTIPVGKTQSYGDIAKALNSSARAVGNACRANPLPLIIPCHRVVSKAGLGGFSGQTTGKMLEIKQWLLDHEKL